jgi:MFS family permease
MPASSEPLLPAAAAAGITRQQLMLIVAAFSTLFSQFAALGMIAPFFAASSEGRWLGPRSVGLIFSSYPLGTVLAVGAALPPWVLQRLGVRATICLGVGISALTSFCFGLAPRFVWDMPLVVTLVACRLAGGAGAALAETASISALSNGGFGDKLGVVISGVEIVIGAAMALGMLLGGFLYAAGDSTVFGAFLFPFFVQLCTTMALLPLVWVALPAHVSDDGGGGAGANDESQLVPRSVWTTSRVLLILSVVLWSAVNEALLPILAPELARPPLLFDSSQTGMVFAEASGIYMLGSIPVGWAIGRPGASRYRKLIMGNGWLTLALAYILLGPVRSVMSPFCSLVAAMAIQGLASSLVIVPTLPDLQSGLDGDELGKAAVSSAWTGAFSLGALLGPFSAAALTASIGFDLTCVLLSVACLFGGVALLALHICLNKKARR